MDNVIFLKFVGNELTPEKIDFKKLISLVEDYFMILVSINEETQQNNQSNLGVPRSNTEKQLHTKKLLFTQKANDNNIQTYFNFFSRNGI